MKHILLAVSLMGAAGASAWNVTTEPTMQSALIEEFTGIHCGNCPDGHRIAAEIIAKHPEDVFTIAIHAGGFANPYPGEPNYVVPLGVMIHDHFGVNSYPCATVNRRVFGTSKIIGRQSWEGASHANVGEKSPVNLWTGCTYDSETRELCLEVEGYFTEDMIDPRLNVFLLQNEILGPQASGQLGSEYPHRHMLRGRLTDADFGDPIIPNSKGEYFVRTFTYTLPAHIGAIPVDPMNIELLTFVTNGEDDVYKVSKSYPEITGADSYLSVSTSAPDLQISKNYGFDFFEMYIYNSGSTAVTSAEFETTLNGNKQTCEWTGTIPPHSRKLVRVPLNGMWKEALSTDDNQYDLRLVKANGKSVSCEAVSGSFGAIELILPTDMSVQIKTDRYAGDNKYRILDMDGKVVKEFGPYENGVAEEYEDAVTLEPDKVYCLEIADNWGDGVRTPTGYVRLFDKDGNQMGEYREVNYYGMRNFFRTEEAPTSVSEIYAPQITKVEYFDLTGRKVAKPATGIYLVHTTYSDGTVSTTKTAL